MTRTQAAAIIFAPEMRSRVMAWLGRMGVPPDDRADLAQEVFLGAHQSFHAYDPERGRPERWLNRIAVHVASHYRARAQHRREQQGADDVAAELVDDLPLAEDVLVAEAKALELTFVMNDLPDDLLGVLRAYMHEVPVTAIAEQHQMPVSTVYKWLARAMSETQWSLRVLWRDRRFQ